MSNHPAIITVVDRIKRDVIGGAADIATECVDALNNLITDSTSNDLNSLNQEFEAAVLSILRVMPSFAPPINAINHLLVTLENGMRDNKPVTEVKRDIQQTSVQFSNTMKVALEKIAIFGAERVPDNGKVFMYSMSSTVWNILKQAKKQGKKFEVVVTESRPGNEGHWTVDAMLDADIPVSSSIDACIGELIPLADVVFVGADAFSSNGYSYCKVGTFPSALVAHRYNVPFYIAADTLKLDPASILGLPFRHDPVPREEVLSEKYPSTVPVVGTLFDETPPDLVTGIITELGIIHPTACFSLIREMKLSQFMERHLAAWAHKTL